MIGLSVWLRFLASWAAYPLLVGGGTTVSAIAMQNGIPNWVALPLVAGSAGIVVVALERFVTFAPEWRFDHNDTLTDVWHLTVSSGMAFALLNLLVQDPAGAAGPDCSRAICVALWPTSWPLALQVALGLLAGEFSTYWVHRFQHHTRFLWRLHAVHHSSERLYWLNSSRNHPIDEVLIVMATALPLHLLGAPHLIVSLILVFGTIHFIFQHSNVDVTLGSMRYIFNLAEVHRWHHSRRLTDSNANYGLVLLVWDWVFRTFHYPPDRAPLDLGLAEPVDFPTRYWAQLASPFSARLWGPARRPGRRSIANPAKSTAMDFKPMRGAVDDGPPAIAAFAAGIAVDPDGAIGKPTT
jgi:ornithine lipid hydroxylase